MATRSRPRTPTLSLAVFISVTVAAVITQMLYPGVAQSVVAAGREDLLPSSAWWAAKVVATVFAATAAVIHRRGPHRIGWVLHGVAVGLIGSDVGLIIYLVDGAGQPLPPGVRVVAGIVGFGWIPAIILMTVFLPLTFPTGRLPGRRWWWVAAVGAAAAVYGMAVVTVEAVQTPLEEQSGGWPVLPVLMLIGTMGAVASVVARYRRANEVERRQIKWVAAALVLACVVIGFSLTPLADAVSTTVGAQLAAFGVMCAIPVSIGIAITRYHLYDIDRIISRTAAYLALSVTLGAVYVSVVFALQHVLHAFAGDSQLAVAGATLTVAALFTPARRRAQATMDRRFDRSHYDVQRTVQALRRRLTQEVDVDRVAEELARAVAETVHPATVSVWLRAPTVPGASTAGGSTASR